MKFVFLNITIFISVFCITSYLSVRSEQGPSKVNENCQASPITTQPELFATEKLVQLPSYAQRLPCKQETSLMLLESNLSYPRVFQDEVEFMTLEIKKTLSEKTGTEEEIEYEIFRTKKFEEGKEHFKKFYPRFKLSESLPGDELYFGIHTENYKDVTRFLGERTCTQPTLSMANSLNSYLGLFFSINNCRNFGGIVRIINERIVTLIEAQFTFGEVDKYFETKMIPRGNFKSWVHEDIERSYKGWVYQDQDINASKDSWRPDFFLSPWLYNSCNRSIATVANNCSLDPSFDMELKEFFYLTRYDLILGNIYCKKSTDAGWTRIATLELVRI